MNEFVFSLAWAQRFTAENDKLDVNEATDNLRLIVREYTARRVNLMECLSTKSFSH